jgi:hypothetical protein
MMRCRKFKTLVLMMSIFLSAFLVFQQYVPAVHAQTEGTPEAEIYFLDLLDVGSYHSWVNNQSDAISGAIEALSISGQRESPANEPMVHIKQSKIAPFWTVQYAIVSDWSVYTDLILNSVGKIILNTHGQILPVPSGWTALDWIDKIAEAMSLRHFTWAHIAGWPFYIAWHHGGNIDWFCASGFQRLMSRIGLGQVLCDPPPGTPQES